MQTKIGGGNRMDSKPVAALPPDSWKNGQLTQRSLGGFLFDKVTMILTTLQYSDNTVNMNNLYNQLHLCKRSIELPGEEVGLLIAELPPVPGRRQSLRPGRWQWLLRNADILGLLLACGGPGTSRSR